MTIQERRQPGSSVIPDLQKGMRLTTRGDLNEHSINKLMNIEIGGAERICLNYCMRNIHRVIKTADLVNELNADTDANQLTRKDKLPIWIYISKLRDALPDKWHIYTLTGEKAYVFASKLKMNDPYVPIGFRDVPDWVTGTEKGSEIAPLFEAARSLSINPVYPDIKLKPDLGSGPYDLLKALAQMWVFAGSGLSFNDLSNLTGLSVIGVEQYLYDLQKYLRTNDYGGVFKTEGNMVAFKPALEE